MGKILKWSSARPADATINIDALANPATFGTSAFPGFASSVPLQTGPGASGYKEISRSDGNPWATIWTTTPWRDGGITAMGRNFSMLVRYNATTTHAIGLQHSWDVGPGGSLAVFVTTGVNLNADFVGGAVGLGNQYPLFSTNDCQGLFGSSGTDVRAGYVRYTYSGLFRLEAIKEDVLLWFNNILLRTFRYEALTAMDPGVCVLGCHPSSTGGYGLIKTISTNYMENLPTPLDRMAQLAPVRELYLPAIGWKNARTTGSMTVGSNVLTVADSSRFDVGDEIMVAIGGEASGGARGSSGVGGYHNDDHVKAASIQALIALTPSNEGKYGFIENPSSPDNGRAIPSSDLQARPEGGGTWYNEVVLSTVTFSPGTPGYVNVPYYRGPVGLYHQFAENFNTLPPELTKGVTYYVKTLENRLLASARFSLSLTPGGPAINLSSFGSGTHLMWNNAAYYTDFKAPKALLAKIQSKAGSALTLDQTAKASTTNADVFFNNTSRNFVFERKLDMGWPYGENVRAVIDGMNYAIWGKIRFNGQGWSFEGRTGQLNDELVTPLGVPGNFFAVTGTETAVRKLRLTSNHRPIGFGLTWEINSYNPASLLGKALELNTWNGSVSDIDAYDIFLNCPGWNACTQTDNSDTTPFGTKRVRIFNSFGDQHYMGWKQVDANSTGITYDNCEIYNVNMSSGFETFQSNGSRFRNIKTVNTKNSDNSSGDTVILNHDWLVQANCAGRSDIRDPVGWNLNTNQDNLQNGFLIDVENHPEGAVFRTDNAANNFQVGYLITFTIFSGGPVGLEPFRPYYVSNIIQAGWKFQVSLTQGGPPIITTGSYTGIIRARRSTLVTFAAGSSIITTGGILSGDEGGALQVGSVVAFATSGTLPSPITSGFAIILIEKLSSITFRGALFADAAPIVFSGSGTGDHNIGRIVSDEVARGVQIIGGKYIQETWPDMLDQSAGWVISGGHPNCLVKGTHLNGTGPPYIKGINPQGFYKSVETCPSYAHGNAILRMSGPGTIIDGVRIGNDTPHEPAGTGNDWLGRIHTEGGSHKIRNCVLPSGQACVTGSGYIEYELQQSHDGAMARLERAERWIGSEHDSVSQVGHRHSGGGLFACGAGRNSDAAAAGRQGDRLNGGWQEHPHACRRESVHGR